MKASCEEVLRRLEVYLDGELSEEEAVALAEHLDACPECLEHEKFLAKLREVVGTKLGTAPDTPEALIDRIRRTIGAAR